MENNTQVMVPVKVEIDAFKPMVQELNAIIEKEKNTEFNLETKKGLADAKSFNYKLRLSKKPVKDKESELKKALDKQKAAISSESKLIIDKIDAIIDIHAGRIKEIEDADKNRVAAIQQRIDNIKRYNQHIDGTSDQVAKFVETLKTMVIDESFEEFEAEAIGYRKQALDFQRERLAQVIQDEKDKAELEELRALKARQEEEERQKEVAESAQDKPVVIGVDLASGADIATYAEVATHTPQEFTRMVEAVTPENSDYIKSKTIPALMMICDLDATQAQNLIDAIRSGLVPFVTITTPNN